MTETKTKSQDGNVPGCRFPIAIDKTCGRPVVKASGDPDGRGRPSNYCDNPEHNRAAAWRARQKLAGQQVQGAELVDEVPTPVTTAGARATVLLDETKALVATLGAAQQALMTELATLGDPDATAAELETVSTAAAENVAQANARAAKAEAGRREDRAQAEEANAAAVELAEQVDAIQGQLVEVRAELAEAERNLAAVERQNAEQDEALSEARLTNGRQFEEIERLTDELGAEEERSATLKQSVDVLTEIKEQLDGDLIRAQEYNNHLDQLFEQAGRERDEQRRRAEMAETRAELAETQAAQLREDVASLRGIVERHQAEAREYLEQANNLGRENAGIVAQLEAAKQALAAEQNHANQRVGDMERTYERQLGELRAEIERLRNGKK